MLYCFQEKKSGALTCLQEKETGALLFLGEGIRYNTVPKRRGLVLYCSQVKGDWAVLLRTEVVQGAVPSLLVDSDESRQLAITKLENILAFAFSRKVSVLSR